MGRGNRAPHRFHGYPRYLLWTLLLGLVGSPLLLLLGVSFNVGDPEDFIPRELGVSNYSRLGQVAGSLWGTLELALGVMILSTILGVTLAWIISRTTIRYKGLLTVLIILPYPLGAMVMALAWAALGSPRGGLLNAALELIPGVENATLINAYSLAGIVVVQSLFQTPVTFLLTQSALRNMDPSLEESSGILGAGKLRTALGVTIPLMLPAIIGAALFAFVSALGAFAIPAILGRQTDFRVVTHEVYLLVSAYPTDYPLAAVLGVILIAVSAVAVYLANLILRKRTYAVVGGKASQGSLVDTGRWKYLLASVVYGYIALAVVFPMLALVIGSLQKTGALDVTSLTWTLSNYSYALFEYPATQQTVWNSLVLGVSTGLVGIALATLIAITVERTRRRGRPDNGLEQLAMAPQAVPRLIFSVPLLMLIILSPIRIYGSLFAILLSYVIVFLPLAYRGMAAVVSQAHPSLEEASRTLGASSLRTTLKITIPLLRSGIMSGAALLFMVSFSELGASILLMTPNSRVLGPVMFSFYDSGGISLVSALAIIQAVIVLLVLIVLRRLGGRLFG